MRNIRSFARTAFAIVLWAGIALCESPEERTPRELEGVGVTEKLGNAVDLNLTFVAESGYPVALKEYFKPGKPVILNLVYYTCPMLCNLVLNGQTSMLRELEWNIGDKFEVVTISIDPTENFKLARDKKALYLASYERPATGWHFLIDNGGSVKRLAEQVGFGYKLDERTGQYAHPAVIFVLTPDGKVARYLYGTRFKPFEVKMALTEAAEGKWGLTVERVLLYCFHYDPAARSYTPFAQNVMRLGGVLMVALLSFVLIGQFRRERKLAASHQGLVTTK